MCLGNWIMEGRIPNLQHTGDKVTHFPPLTLRGAQVQEGQAGKFERDRREVPEHLAVMVACPRADSRRA